MICGYGPYGCAPDGPDPDLPVRKREARAGRIMHLIGASGRSVHGTYQLNGTGMPRCVFIGERCYIPTNRYTLREVREDESVLLRLPPEELK